MEFSVWFDLKFGKYCEFNQNYLLIMFEWTIATFVYSVQRSEVIDSTWFPLSLYHSPLKHTHYHLSCINKLFCFMYETNHIEFQSYQMERFKLKAMSHKWHKHWFAAEVFIFKSCAKKILFHFRRRLKNKSSRTFQIKANVRFNVNVARQIWK